MRWLKIEGAHKGSEEPVVTRTSTPRVCVSINSRHRSCVAAHSFIVSICIPEWACVCLYRCVFSFLIICVLSLLVWQFPECVCVSPLVLRLRWMNLKCLYIIFSSFDRLLSTVNDHCDCNLCVTFPLCCWSWVQYLQYLNSGFSTVS